MNSPCFRARLLSGSIASAFLLLPALSVEFEKDVAPILGAKCGDCHGDETREANLDLRTVAAMLRGGDSGTSLVKGKPEESLLIEVIDSGDMPPKRKPQLTKEEIETLREWVKAGAPSSGGDTIDSWTQRLEEGRSYWAFQPPQRPLLPNAETTEAPVRSAPPISPNDESIRPQLQAWYRAKSLELDTDERVTQWKDESGNDRHLAPTWKRVDANVGAPPRFQQASTINGQPAVRFDDISGLASPADNPVEISGDAAWTMSAVVHLRPPPQRGHTAVIVGFGDPAPGHNPGRPWASLLEIGREGAYLSHSGGFGHNAQLPPQSMWPWYDRPVVITVVKEKGSMRDATTVFLNGQPVDSPLSGVETTPDIRHRTDMGIYLGRASDQLGALRGDIAEVAIYNAALEPDQREGVEAGWLRQYEISSARSEKHPIDAFVRTRLREAGLESAPAADRRTLIRRATFDLTGLPPKPEDVEQFVNDEKEGAWERVIERLLDSPHYGERWGRHWLDVARYADTGGYETDVYYRNAWRYRDYVVKSFNDDKPYNRFVQEQIAGDELWPNNLDLEGGYVMDPEKLRHFEALTGTGLYALGPEIHESNLNAKLRNYERLTDWVDTTASAFMGLTFACARCHDHKFDPISQRDYFALQSIFAGSREVEVPMQHGMGIADWKQHYPKVIAVEEARMAYEHFVQQTSGRARTPEEEEKLQSLKNSIADRILALPKTDAQKQPYVGIYERPSVSALGLHRPELMPAVHFLSRGELSKPKQKMEPALPALLAELTETGHELAPGPAGTRRELALWLTRPDHPLTTRVMVNRIWQWHFGQGIVSTASDFGKMGVEPTHPELLDWLATEFVARGWSLKAMHRLIMTSETYRQSSSFHTSVHGQKDPDNTLLWRMNRRRLEGEAIWDAIHLVSGTINLAVGGRPVMPPLLAEELTNKSNWVESEIPSDHRRRGLYIIVRRNFKFPLFDLFDAPVNAVSCSGRNVSTVAPQALWLLNNQTGFHQAEHFAERLVREAGADSSEQVKRAFELALSRTASEQEVSESLAMVEQFTADPSPEAHREALTKLCLVLFNLNEFLHID